MNLIFIFIATMCFAQAPIGEDVTSHFKDKKIITQTLKKYATAFEEKNFKILKTTVSENFIKLTGGTKSWEEKFNKLKNEKPQSIDIKNLKIVSRNDKIYVRFDTYEVMPTGSWFLMKKTKKGYLLDEPINDFDPE